MEAVPDDVWLTSVQKLCTIRLGVEVLPGVEARPCDAWVKTLSVGITTVMLPLQTMHMLYDV